MLLIGTQMLLNITQTTTSCRINQGGEGEFECLSVHVSFYELVPL